MCQIRWDLLENGGVGLNAYSSVDVTRRIAEALTGDGFRGILLKTALEADYRSRHPGDDLSHWQRSAAMAFLGRPAGKGDPRRLWQIVSEHCGGKQAEQAPRDRDYARQVLSESRCAGRADVRAGQPRVGGDWPGAPGEATEFPASMEIDYVRVWQRAE